jgi:hypothetical protein
MNKEWQIPKPDADRLIDRVEELRSQIRMVPPDELAKRTGSRFEADNGKGGTFRVDYWDEEIDISYPEIVAYGISSGKALNTFDQAMLAYYFSCSDGTPLAGSWIAYSELPDGSFYAQAFQGYTSGPLNRAFGNDLEIFSRAAGSLSGRKPWSAGDLGDRAFVFPVFPQVSLLAVCWQGDEEFPSSYRILFDSAASHHLTTDACAILGSTLTRRLIKAYERINERQKSSTE